MPNNRFSQLDRQNYLVFYLTLHFGTGSHLGSEALAEASICPIVAAPVYQVILACTVVPFSYYQNLPGQYFLPSQDYGGVIMVMLGI